jgi:hypothetical protein|tara:strand:- start:733 stop:939 length:207 start_codon:yes stop_codon:yes gene_type:complete
MNYDYFIDVRIVGLENVFEFLNYQKKQFTLKGMQFEHDVLVDVEDFDTYVVRMWMDPQDYIDFYGSKN